MTALEIEAMLLRWTAAIRFVETVDERGRWELLGEVVDPSPELAAASLREAERRGVSKFAEQLARGRCWLGDDRDRMAAAQAEPTDAVAA